MEMEILLVEKMKKLFLFFKKTNKQVMPMCVRHLETFSSSLSKNWSCSSLSSAHQVRAILYPQTNPKHFPGWRLPWGGVDTESFHEGEILELSLLKKERNTKYFFILFYLFIYFYFYLICSGFCHTLK